jgi:hypothetical protein
MRVSRNTLALMDVSIHAGEDLREYRYYLPFPHSIPLPFL